MESYDGHTNKAKEISMEKFTNRSIQNNELDQEQFSLQDRIQNIHNFENEDTTRDQEMDTPIKQQNPYAGMPKFR